MKSIANLSLVLLTAVAFAALPVKAQSDSTTTTNTAPAPRPRAAQFRGTISAIDTTEMTLTLKGRTNETKVKVTSETKIVKDREPAVFSDAQVGMRASGSGKKQDDGSWIASTLRISTAPARPPAPATPPPAASDTTK